MSRLLQEQQEYFLLICKWGIMVYERGYCCTFGDAFRDSRATFPYAPSGAASFHPKRKALDVNLFRDGVWLTTTEEWRECGELWESLDPRCSWGGHFDDANHLSFGEGDDHNQDQHA